MNELNNLLDEIIFALEVIAVMILFGYALGWL